MAINWPVLWCFMWHGWHWNFVHTGADGFRDGDGVNTWWCPRCKVQRASRL